MKVNCVFSLFMLQFPEMAGFIHGEESNKFENGLGNYQIYTNVITHRKHADEAVYRYSGTTSFTAYHLGPRRLLHHVDGPLVTSSYK